MLTKPLHAGNIAVSFAAVATAADLTFTGGAGAAISMALSGTELFGKSGDKVTKALARKMADHMQSVMDNAHLTADRARITAQMLAQYPPSKPDLAAGNMDAPTIAAASRARIAQTAADPAHQTDTALGDFETILAQTLAPFLEPQDDMQAMVQELLARTDQSGQGDRLREEGITERAIIRLAQRVARDVDDLGLAWNELQNAMDIAVRVQQDGRITSNHGDFVDEVLRRVAEFSAEGEYSDASAAIAEALAREEAEHQARKTRLLDSGIEIAMLDGDSATAARLLVEKADLESGGRAAFDELRKQFLFYHEHGRDHGSALDLLISIDLAHILKERAVDPDQRGYALNDKATSHAILGERESGKVRLEAAVEAYKEALVERPRDRVPLKWAATQVNLGAVFQSLGARENGTAKLEASVEAYKAALDEFVRDKVPQEWATTQMNLGNALRTLGERGQNAALLEEAVEAFEMALGVQSRDRSPMEWARIQLNLGSALNRLGRLVNDAVRLEAAVTAFNAALQEWTQDRVPLQWAACQMNLGAALQSLGVRESGTARLELSLRAFEDALKVRTRDRVPLHWATTQFNLSSVLVAFFDKTEDPTYLDRGQTHLDAAREVFEEAGATHYLAQSDAHQAAIENRR